jgi:nitrogen fixation/metabolism regulation signal transduction histidine kinase
MDAQLAQVAHIAWSPQRRVLFAEGACELVLGASAEDLVGRPLHQALAISESRARELHQAALESRPSQVEFVTSRAANEAGVLRLALAVRDGNPCAAVANLRHFLMGAPPVQVSALASSLSHEIRNPLSSVKMAVQTLARNNSLSERDRRRLAIANREIRTMERMLWLLSEYGREAPPTLESVPLKTLVQEAAALVEPELSERRIELAIMGDASARAHVEAGRVARVLSQVLLNIAISQSEGSRMDVHIGPGPSGGFEVRMTDPAAVRSAEQSASLFEPFSSMLSRGAGLSLAALNRVMESHGGKLSAHWSEGRGTLYTLTFPG